MLQEDPRAARLHQWLNLSSGSGSASGDKLKAILLAAAETPAAKALATAVWSSGQPITVHAVTPATLGRHVHLIQAGHAMPVGDRELTMRSLAYAGIADPKWACYPQDLLAHMQHMPRLTTVTAALRMPKPSFLRPAWGGAFRGFVLRESIDEMSAMARTSLEAILSMPRNTVIWAGAALELVSVWRYYVLDGELLGYALVSGSDEREPEGAEVSAIIAAAPQDVAYLLDMAVLRDGSTTLLRTRDVLGMGYPEGRSRHAPSPLDFLRLSWSRWTQLYLRAHAGDASADSVAIRA